MSGMSVPLRYLTQFFPLIVKAGEHLGSVHSELHSFESHAPANGLELFGQINRAHTPFPQRSKDAISSEVVIIGRCCIKGARGGFVCAGRTLESAQDETLRAQSGGIAGTQFRSALRAI